MVILCYRGAFAPSTPVPDPTPGVSGVFDQGGAEAGDVARAAVRGGRSGSTAAYGGAALIVATVAGGRTLPVHLRVVRVRAGACACVCACALLTLRMKAQVAYVATVVRMKPRVP